jgi:hypothetical protein
MVSGVEKHFAGQTLVLNGVSMTADAVVTLLNSLPPKMATSLASQTAAKTDIAAANATAAEIQPVMSALRGLVRVQFGASSPVVEDFGMKPLTRRTPTVATKVEAVQKTLATRADRKTMGKRQKAAIHGTVPQKPKTAP